MKIYRFVAYDKHGEKRCWAWGPSFKIAHTRCNQAIREFIRMEGVLYGQYDEWTLRWELRSGVNDPLEYLPKPKQKSPAKRRRKKTSESAV